MARKLKVYQTSLGFYDLAIAAPSMKAALDAWGAESNLFHQGVARESDDPDVTVAAMSKPGVILRRPVGSNGPFKEHAELPTHLSGGLDHGQEKVRAKPRQPRPTIDDKSDSRAAVAFESAQRRRETERRKEEAVREKQRQRRQQAIAKAQGAIEKAKREHDSRAAAIGAERDALEKRSQAEDARWEKQREKLEITLRRARD